MFTRRENEVAFLFAAGNSVTAVAAMLEISRNTVRSHLRTIHHKTDTHDRLQLAIWLCRSGATTILYLLVQSTLRGEVYVSD